MTSKRNRTLDGLGDPAYAELAFQAIERAFDPQWLEIKGDHPVKRLWNRPDRLATVELFVFGAALEKLQRTQPEWLKMTVKKIKTSKPYIGFITEVITCAQLEIVNGKLEPAGNGQRGYDLVAFFDHGARHFISIKNHDESDTQKEFNRRSKHLRNLWIQKLVLEKKSLALRVVGSRPLSEEDFEHIKRHIQNNLCSIDQKPIDIADGVTVTVAPLHRTEGSLSKNRPSDMFMVVAPAPESEQHRFARNIRQAATNMKKNIAIDEKSYNVIFMRVHVNADLDFLVETAQYMLNTGMSGVDCILFYQPSYGRDSSNRSLISNAFRPAISMRYIQSLDGRPAYKIMPALGTVSLEPSRQVLIVDGNQHPLPPNTYVFQAGDIYIIGDKPNEGNLSSPASGIREHAVLYFQGREIVFEGKMFPQNCDLLII